MKSEIQKRAPFEEIRYAQCWEDADVLIAALAPKGRNCVSIGSAGDNSFSLLAAGAASVSVVELNPAQIACIELRRTAYLTLEYEEFLQLLGSRDSNNRISYYNKCRSTMNENARIFWDGHQEMIAAGIGGEGKFERYFKIFRKWFLPLAQTNRRVESLLQSASLEQRLSFYNREWNNRRWRIIFRLFFSRWVMGRMGRDPEFFRYVDGSVAERILKSTRHALVDLDPANNPYMHWILTGKHGDALPHALREESFHSIRERLADGNAFTVVHEPLEAFLHQNCKQYDAFNLSDIFEYMSEAATNQLLREIVQHSRGGARLAYWNMLVPRSRPREMKDMLLSLHDEALELLAKDKAWFYSRFVIEEVIT